MSTGAVNGPSWRGWLMRMLVVGLCSFAVVVLARTGLRLWEGRDAAVPSVAIVAPDRLAAALLIDGQPLDMTDAPTELPNGARFAVRITSPVDGVVELHPVSPDGRRATEPLWTAPVQAGETLDTPRLRLDGQRGLETLRVLLRAPGGAPMAEQQIVIRHR